jgi:hypothetical protein
MKPLATACHKIYSEVLELVLNLHDNRNNVINL